MTTLTEIPDFSGSGVVYRDVEVRYTHREYGGWVVVNSANGRRLGWVVADSTGVWYAYSGADPFRKVEDDFREYVPDWLSGRYEGTRYRHVALDRTRAEAVRSLLGCLFRLRAPALAGPCQYRIETDGSRYALCPDPAVPGRLFCQEHLPA
jgi:hypothetical protein